jgi:hypothetical protein
MFAHGASSRRRRQQVRWLRDSNMKTVPVLESSLRVRNNLLARAVVAIPYSDSVVISTVLA